MRRRDLIKGMLYLKPVILLLIYSQFVNGPLRRLSVCEWHS
jgi:hypothetical protein